MKPEIRLLNECFIYNPNSGKIFWRKTRPLYHLTPAGYKGWKTRWAGKEVPSVDYRPEVNFTVKGVTYKVIASLACWAMHHNRWPAKFIDHKNGDDRDNKISNLRLASNGQNSRNGKIHKDNKSGFKGVFWSKHAKMFAVQICKNGKKKHLGYFRDPRKAHEAYVAEAKILFGRFARFA